MMIFASDPSGDIIIFKKLLYGDGTNKDIYQQYPIGLWILLLPSTLLPFNFEVSIRIYLITIDSVLSAILAYSNKRKFFWISITAPFSAIWLQEEIFAVLGLVILKRKNQRALTWSLLAAFVKIHYFILAIPALLRNKSHYMAAAVGSIFLYEVYEILYFSFDPPINFAIGIFPALQILFDLEIGIVKLGSVALIFSYFMLRKSCVERREELFFVLFTLFLYHIQPEYMVLLLPLFHKKLENDSAFCLIYVMLVVAACSSNVLYVFDLIILKTVFDFCVFGLSVLIVERMINVKNS